MNFDFEMYESCIKMLEIIFDPDSNEDETAMARATLIELAAPEYMEAMMDSIEEDCCDDEDCPWCNTPFMDSQTWIGRPSLN